ncbi:O-antigen ligase family protein [Candidatus Halobeggiatoa sp. HSG11]|nr:O-antigen ligase family protein [Candidatus Halobeggiatoa sp. HSG11]
MSIIIIIPGLLALYIALTQSLQKAFLNVYLPVILFLPTYYTWKVPGFPDPNFQQAAVLPIMIIWVLRGMQGWKFSLTDILVFSYVFIIGYSEYSHVGYSNAQNFIANVVGGAILFPYILGKCLIEPFHLREEFAKRVVIILIIVAFFSAYQSITLSNFTLWQRALGRFFGGQGWTWVTQYRWGLPRAAGPYGHAILAGIIMVIGYRIQRWLEWSKAWPTHIPRLNWLPISPARLFTLILLFGSIATLVRGPLLAAIFAVFIPLIGLTKKRWLIVGILLTGFIVISIPATNWFMNYVSVDPESVETKSHKTVIYRWNLINNYIEIGKEQFYLGYGRIKYPKIKGQLSIDNHYLLLFLKHGILGLGFFIAIMFIMMLRLFIHSMSQPISNLPGSSLGLTLLSLYVVMLISLATVWMGGQTIHVFFLIVGWTDAYLRSKSDTIESTDNPVAISTNQFQFRRTF